MKKLILLALTWLISTLLYAQNVGIGTTTPHANAILEVNSTNKGLLLPRVADTNAVAGIKPAGLTIYSNSDNRLYFYDGSKWQSSTATNSSDSLWYLINDSTVYSNRKQVGFGLPNGLSPAASFHAAGSFLMQQPLLLVNTAPTPAQTFTMNNTPDVVFLSSTDSVFRILDPGGASNPYTNLNQGSIRIFSIMEDYSAYQIEFAASGFGLGAGDTLWISTAGMPEFKTDYLYRFTNISTSPSTITVPHNYIDPLYIYFRANGDGVNGNGFDITVRKLYKSQMTMKPVVPFGKAMSFSPEDVSFRVGLLKGDPVGFGSIGMGHNVSSRGAYSLALGKNVNSDSLASISIGSDLNSRGNNSIAIGSVNTVGQESIALGVNIAAAGLKKVGLGNAINITGIQGIAIGNNIINGGDFSFTAGHGVNTTGSFNVAIGANLSAAMRSVSIGSESTASGSNAVGIGYNTNVTTDGVAIGPSVQVTGASGVAIGSQSQSLGVGAVALGADSYASGSNSIAIGSIANATANGAVAIGRSVTASGNNSTALGYLTFATFTNATAMGTLTEANGLASTAMGSHTRANAAYSLVAGRYNDPIEPVGASYGENTPIFILGNGTSNDVRTNAFLIRASGNTQINGYTTLGKTSEQAPAIKMKEITGQNSALTQGGVVIFPHGLSREKILAMNVILNYGAGDVLPSYRASTGYEFSVAYDDINIYVYNITGNSINILNKPLKVLMTYKE